MIKNLHPLLYEVKLINFIIILYYCYCNYNYILYYEFGNKINTKDKDSIKIKKKKKRGVLNNKRKNKQNRIKKRFYYEMVGYCDFRA